MSRRWLLGLLTLSFVALSASGAFAAARALRPTAPQAATIALITGRAQAGIGGAEPNGTSHEPDPEERAVRGPHPRPALSAAASPAGLPAATGRSDRSLYRVASRSLPAGGRLLASWYGSECQGFETANGERFDRAVLTAAHRTLPFGTLLRVTNLNTGRSVVVRVNDRGPWVAGREIDLAEAAFGELAPLEAGVIPVGLEVVTPGDHVSGN